MNVPKLLQLSEAFMVSSVAPDMCQLHDFPSGNIGGVNTFIPEPQVKQSYINSYMRDVDPFILG